MPTTLSVLSSHSWILLPLEWLPVPRAAASTKRSGFLCQWVCKLLELFEKIVKEKFSGDAECELRTVLSGAGRNVI